MHASRIYCIDKFGRVLEFTHAYSKFKDGAHADATACV